MISLLQLLQNANENDVVRWQGLSRETSYVTGLGLVAGEASALTIMIGGPELR